MMHVSRLLAHALEYLRGCILDSAQRPASVWATDHHAT
jgi:hypothetical protein